MWQAGRQNITLVENEVHVWKADLKVDAKKAKAFWTTLSKEEKERADRFRFTEHRTYFIASRGILRQLLSRYLSLPAGSFFFSYGKQGKPELTQFPELQFNVSHSRGHALFAFAKNESVGVDLEFIDSTIEFEVIAPRFFSKNEATTLLGLPIERQPAVFFNCWTRKEAFIKAKGGGLSIPLDQFEVTLLENDPAKLLAIDWAPEEVELWSMFSFFPEKEMVGSLAIKYRVERVVFYDF